jgi:hypothetical protein
MLKIDDEFGDTSDDLDLDFIGFSDIEPASATATTNFPVFNATSNVASTLRQQSVTSPFVWC